MVLKKGLFKKIILGMIGAIILFIIIVILNFMIFQKMATMVSKGKPIDNFIEPVAALLVVDIQEATTGVVSTDTFYKKKADELIQNINRLAKRYQKTGKPVIYVRSEITNPLLNLLNNSYAKGSIGAQFDNRMELTSGIEVVKKRSDSFLSTKLDSVLNSYKVNELFIVGLDAVHCVNITAEAAQNRNYKVHIIEEAVLAKSDALKDSMLIVFKSRGINVLRIDNLKGLEN